MTCEEAENLVCARMDGELRAGDAASIELDAHLAGCAACRATAETTDLQDAALVRAFAPTRRSADAVAERVAASARASVRPWRRWAVGLAASVALAAGAVVLLVLGARSGHGPQASEATPPTPIAVAGGVVDEAFACPTHDDPASASRVAELLMRVKQESGAGSGSDATCTTMTPGSVEQAIRAQGGPWCDTLARHVRSPASHADRATRVAAARLLADLATPAAIGDLVELTGDADGHVRMHATTALRRLTGQQLGASPLACATDSSDAVARTQKAWQEWWTQNESKYAGK